MQMGQWPCFEAPDCDVAKIEVTIVVGVLVGCLIDS